ncbi:MAG: N-acetyl-D-Glu racemase DgcA [Bdellovibrionales bacterium]
MKKALILTAKIERWPLAKAFTISRGSKMEACVVTAEVSDGIHTGRGECAPYARYKETPESVLTAIEAIRPVLARGLDRQALQTILPAGAARNALDCALWDIEAKQKNIAAHRIAGLPALQPLTTALTISLDTPERMAEAAAKAASWPLLKIKLGHAHVEASIAAIRQAAPHARLIVDANEGWTPDNLWQNFVACAEAGVTMIEQPLPEAEDAALAAIPHPVPVCADESVKDNSSLAGLTGKYECINIKLDKAGGLTEALRMTGTAKNLGLTVMAGCMVSTSLGIAPAMVFAQEASVVDLDGPLWLAKDRVPGLRYDDHCVYPAEKALWG